MQEVKTYLCNASMQDVVRCVRESSRRMMRAVDWPAAAEQPRSRLQSVLPSGSPRVADAAPADKEEPKCSPGGGGGGLEARAKEVAGAPAGSREEHSGNPQGSAAFWPRAIQAARQLSVWPSCIFLAIEDWTERFWQVSSCSCFVTMP